MLVGRTQILAIAAAAATFLAALEVRAEGGGGYTPCMVVPVFIQPTISQPLIQRGEMILPTIQRADSAKWGVILPDFERPAMVVPVVIYPRYDGCTEQQQRRQAESAAAVSTGVGRVLMAPPTAASRLMKGADDCCGNAGGR